MRLSEQLPHIRHERVSAVLVQLINIPEHPGACFQQTAFRNHLVHTPCMSVNIIAIAPDDQISRRVIQWITTVERQRICVE